MSKRLEGTASPNSPRAEWVKPTMQRFKAADAGVNTGTVDDGDPGTALTNS